jgi:hypothetical protein
MDGRVAKQSHIGGGIWGAGVALAAILGALGGACGLAGATGPASSSTSGGGTDSSSSHHPSSSSGRQLGNGGSGGIGGAAGVGGAGGIGGGLGGASGAGGVPNGSVTTAVSTTNASSSTGPRPTCTDEYGSAPGFVLCVETDTTCDFNLDTGGTTSCDATCTALGGGCIQAFDNGGPCDLFSNTNVACNDAHYATTLCRCTHF